MTSVTEVVETETTTNVKVETGTTQSTAKKVTVKGGTATKGKNDIVSPFRQSSLKKIHIAKAVPVEGVRDYENDDLILVSSIADSFSFPKGVSIVNFQNV